VAKQLRLRRRNRDSNATPNILMRKSVMILRTCDLNHPPIPSKVSVSPPSWKHPVKHRPNATVIVTAGGDGSPADTRRESYTIKDAAPRTLPVTGKYDMLRMRYPGGRSARLGDGRRDTNIHTMKKERILDPRPAAPLPERKARILLEISQQDLVGSMMLQDLTTLGGRTVVRPLSPSAAASSAFSRERHHNKNKDDRGATTELGWISRDGQDYGKATFKLILVNQLMTRAFNCTPFSSQVRQSNPRVLSFSILLMVRMLFLPAACIIFNCLWLFTHSPR
jgi:hypothetical protein